MKHVKLTFETLTQSDGAEAQLAFLKLNRPEVSNAFNAAMIREITECCSEVQDSLTCRVLVVTGEGKNFSGGADLGWMKRSSELSLDQNFDEAYKMLEMFEAISELKIPTIAAVFGSVFGGAVGLTAVCDYAVAAEDTKFCLSEARLGLIPAVILPYLSRKIPMGKLKRLAMTADVFSAKDAYHFGLVDHLLDSENFTFALRNELNLFLGCGPNAQTTFKQLIEDLRKIHFAQNEITAKSIARLRASVEGQQGLASFFSKSAPPWKAQVAEHDASSAEK